MAVAFKNIWRLLTPAQRRGAVALMGLMLVGAVIEALGVGLMIPLIALMTQADIGSQYPVIAPALEWLGHSGQNALIVGAMLGLIAVYVVKGVFLLFVAWRDARFVSGLQAHFSQRLFATYLRQPYTFHLQRNSAQLIHNATGEVSVFTHRAVASAIIAMTEFLTLAAITSLALTIEPVGVLVVALVLGVAGVGYHLITRAHLTRWGQAQDYHEGLRMHHLMQGLGAAKDVKLLGREADFLAQFHAHNIEGARVGQQLSTLQQVPRLWLELLAVAGLAALVITMVNRGDDSAAILPTVGFIAAASFRLMPSVNRILGALQSLESSAPIVANLRDELRLNSPEAKPRIKGGIVSLQQGIVLDDVGYAYPGAQTPALSQVSIRIHKGETVGLIGPSGSGKSTLVDVLLGLLTPASGQVLVDGHDIQPNLRDWQDRIGYVPQSIYLTDDTLRRNVAFGLSEDQIDDEAVKEAIRAAQLEDFVAGLEKGLGTFVGERGIRLSGGQRQRIGIARALYHEPAVLVLDEATSALDGEAERGVMEAVTTLRGRKTIVIVAHRTTTVEQCDRLYRMEQGRIVAEGVPTELLS